MTHLSSILLLLLAALPFQDPEAEPAKPPKTVLPAAIWTQMDNVAHQLAKGGREKEYKHLIETLVELGMPEAQLAKLKTACVNEMQRVTKIQDALPDATKRLKAVSRQVAALVEKAPEEEQQRVAKVLLVLDDSVEWAHKALGHEMLGKVWMSPEQKQVRQRRGDILDAIGKVSKLEPELESGESQDELLLKINGGPGSFVKYGGYVMQSSLTEERTRRVMTEVLRAEALSAWLRGKDTEPKLPKKPPEMGGRRFFLLDQQQKYHRAVDLAHEAGELKDEEATQIRDLGAFSGKRNTDFIFSNFESALETNIFVSLNTTPSPLHMISIYGGHLNWVSLTMFGISIPGYVWKNKESGPPKETTYVDNPADRKLRDEKMQLAKAGIFGCRSWVAFLAERNEDPKWEDSFVDELGKLRGEALLKATMMVEYIQELDLMPSLIKSLATAKRADRTYTVMGKALGMPVSTFEAHWRDWIVRNDDGIAQQVDKVVNLSRSPDEIAAMKRLNQIRRNTFEGKVKDVPDLQLEAEVSDAAQKHAEYLVLNPEQADKWPDAHEEYRDKEGYSPEGQWSGNHANVLSGLDDPDAAIDGWIATFYHRLPMLDPELMRVGWGQAGKIAVLDISTFVRPPEREWMVVFPYDGMKDVPPKFGKYEWPNPIPDEPEQDFGYPITLQLGRTKPDEPSAEISMHLMDGKTEVECHFSTPSKPTNPFAVPRDTWCLIPKTALKSNTTYTVVADWYQPTKTVTWTFKTGN